MTRLVLATLLISILGIYFRRWPKVDSSKLLNQPKINLITNATAAILAVLAVFVGTVCRTELTRNLDIGFGCICIFLLTISLTKWFHAGSASWETADQVANIWLFVGFCLLGAFAACDKGIEISHSLRLVRFLSALAYLIAAIGIQWFVQLGVEAAEAVWYEKWPNWFWTWPRCARLFSNINISGLRRRT